MEKQQIIITNTNVPSNDFSKFEQFLQDYKLPTDDVIASPDERRRIMNAIPEFLASLPEDTRKNARYLSKFIAGSAVRLFDASLNFVWNEVVLSLRKKIVIYGLDMFFDNAVGNYERGSRVQDMENAKKLTDIFEVSLDYLLGQTNNFTLEKG